MAFLAMLTGAARGDDAPLSLLPADPEPPQLSAMLPESGGEKASTAKTEAVPQPKTAPAPAAAPPKPPGSAITVRIGQHQDFERIVFDWPRNVAYKLTRDGDRATLHFEAPGEIRLAAPARLAGARHLTSTADDRGNLVVSFTLDAKAVLKDFTSGTSVGIDVQAVARQDSKPSPKATAAATVADQSKNVKEAKEVAPPAPAAAPAPAHPPAAGAAPVAPAKAASDKAADKAQPPPASTASVATANAGAAAAEQTMSGLVASLDPHTPARAVVWARGGFGYIVFDRKFTLSLDALTAGQPAPTVALQALDLPKASGFRFPLPDKFQLHATLHGSVWKLFAAQEKPDVPVSASLVAQPDFALGARYLLPLPDAPEVVHFTDPVVGDELILVPLNQTQAFSVARRMTEFQIWPAAQGMVIKPLIDKLAVRNVSDGIEITTDTGLLMSDANDTGAVQQSPQKAKAAVAGKSLFDFAVWRGKPDETFTRTRQRLQQTIVDVPDRERNRARLELARFYFARGYGEEATAFLAYLAREVPDLSAHADFLALSGAAKILANRPDEGLKDLDASGLNDQPEIKLWQAVGNAELRNWTEAEDKFAAAEAILSGYPEPFYSRYFVLAVESALAVGNNREAADWLDRLETGPHNPAVDPAIDYLHGVLHAKSGRAQAAAAAWKTVAASNDQLYKIRAELALIDLGVASLSMTPAQAADRLEALRFGWRGDDLEVDILHRLGQFYIQAKNVRAGLASLAQAIQLYPNSPMVPKIREEMSASFRDVFLGALGKDFSPLEALTLYQQYRNTLMPTGEDGIAVTRNLAERLTAIDLMDQAGDLLEDLVKNKLTGTDKARVASRLAAIRLLDHKPQPALDALDLIPSDSLPQNLQHERMLLRAKALSELHRDDEAMAILKDDTGFSAKLLRADISMHAQRWGDAAKALLDVIGPPPKTGETIPPDEADWLVRCAVAMALAGDQPGLDHLAIDYGAMMAGTPQNDTFRILVQPDRPGQLRDIAAAQSKISDVDMFQGFLNSYRKADTTAEAKKP